MKLIDGKLYIEYQELIDAAIPEGTVKAALSRKSWIAINDPEDRRRVLVLFEGLKDVYRDAITKKYGNPYIAASSRLLDKYLVAKPEDIDFLAGYKLSDGRNIPAPTLAKYINDIKVLHMISHLQTKEQLRSLGVQDKATFWQMISALVKRLDCSLPTDRARLQAKVSEYKISGPQTVISKAFCNTSAKKVKDELSEAYLLELLRNPNQFDCERVCLAYNTWAQSNNHKTITGQTVLNYYRKNRITIDADRYGSKNWKSTFEPVKHRARPSAPLLLINSDDNELDLYYQSQDEKGKLTKYAKVKLLVVMDAFNDYPLGYAMTDGNVTIDVVKEAYLNAVHHIKQLTGSYYLPHQLQADHWASASLFPWYEKIGHFIPSRIHNSQARRIEAAFNHHWHNSLKRYINYSGHNITADAKANTEAIQRNSKDFPHISQAPAQVYDHIETLRHRITKSGSTLQQEWLQAFSEMPSERKRSLSSEQRMLLFGKQTKRPVTLTKEGVVFTLDQQKVIYMPSLQEYQSHWGRILNIAYDPYDLNTILAFNEDRSIQLICEPSEQFKDTIADMQPGDRARLNIVLKQHKELAQWATQTKPQQQAALLRGAGVDPNAALLSGGFRKEIRSSIESEYQLLQLGEAPINDVYDQDESQSIKNDSDSHAFDIWDSDNI